MTEEEFKFVGVIGPFIFKITLGFVTLFVTPVCNWRILCPLGFVAGLRGLGIFILEPVFMVCLCLGLHQRLSSSPEPLKCKASSEAVQQDGDPAGAVELSPSFP